MSLTIALINGKGGVGKTTVSLLLALALRQVRRDVVLLDRDPQKSATTFAENMGLPVVDSPPADGPLVIIDTPPNIHHPDTLWAIRTADVVVLITTPSPTDIGATAATAAIIAQQRSRRTLVLFNRIQASNRFASTLPAIAARLPFPTLHRVLYQRTAYQVAQLEGWRALPAAARIELAQVALELFAAAPELSHSANIAQSHIAEMAPSHDAEPAHSHIAAVAPSQSANATQPHIGNMAQSHHAAVAQ
jgi:chromosome partitioning protein